MKLVEPVPGTFEREKWEKYGKGGMYDLCHDLCQIFWHDLCQLFYTDMQHCTI